MTNETPPAAQSGELDPRPQTAYQRSVDQLFDLLPDQDGASQPHYCTVEWAAEDPARITDVTIITATPTGARRQERRGVFHSAQFAVTEMSSITGEERERFIWCHTGPRQAGTPIKIDPKAFAEDYGYQEFTSKSAVSILTQRATSVQDYTMLVTAMRSRNLRPVPELTDGVNRLISQLAHSGFRNADSAAEAQLDRAQMFELISAYQTLGAEASKVTQGYLLSQLLWVIGQRRLEPSPVVTEASDSAALILEMAIRQGFIPDEPRTMHRVLASSHMYYYPFATDLLHTRLQHENSREIGLIFGTGRLRFVHDYIAIVLQCGATRLDSHVEQFLRNSCLHRYEGTPTQQLCDLLNGLLQRADKLAASPHVPEKNAVTGLEVRSLAGVWPAFARILFTMHGSTLTDFDRKSVGIVKAILAPVTLRQLGRHAAAGSELDEDV